MNKLIALPLTVLLASCGSGESGDSTQILSDNSLEFDRNAEVANACASNYYEEIAGNYDGQISYDKDDGSLSCRWEVELQITSNYTTDPNTRQICDLTFNMASTGGVNTGCSDIGTGGEILDSLASPNNNQFWTNTPWPIDAAARMATTVSENLVFPIGLANSPTRQFTIIFDGFGNITYPENNAILPEWSGVLVKE